MDKLLSVIIPAFQAERTIERAVNSALAIPCDAVEIVVVNDGSTDRTAPILEALASQDQRVVVISQENKGRSAARNRGVRAAAGEWIMFLDSDDYLLPDAFPGVLEKCQTSNSPLVVFGMHSVDRPEHIEASNNHARHLVAADVFLKAMIDTDSVSFLKDGLRYESNAVWSRLYRRETLLSLSTSTDSLFNPFPEGLRFSEDRLLNIAYLNILGNNTVEFCSDALYYWDLDESSTCSAARIGDSEALKLFISTTMRMSSLGIVDSDDAACIIAREAMVHFQRLARTSRNENKELVEEYLKVLGSSDVALAIKGSLNRSYTQHFFWRFMSLLIASGHACFAYRLSSFAYGGRGAIKSLL